MVRKALTWILATVAVSLALNTVTWAGNVYSVVIVPRTSAEEAKLGNGDLNDDGKLNIIDTVRVNDILRGQTEPSFEDVLRGDVNFNGRIDLDDQTIIVKVSLGVGGPLPTAKHLPGDANKDGKVDIFDAVTVVDHLLGRPVAMMAYNADCNRDGRIDYRDRDGIVNHILGLSKCR